MDTYKYRDKLLKSKKKGGVKRWIAVPIWMILLSHLSWGVEPLYTARVFFTHSKIAKDAANLLKEKHGDTYKEIYETYLGSEGWGDDLLGGKGLLIGTIEEDAVRGYKRQENHAYNPKTGKGKYDPKSGKHRASALRWAMGTEKDEVENKENEYDWQDARRWYEIGHKVKAYESLGHVVHLLQDVSVPPHTLPKSLSDINSPIAEIGLPDGHLKDIFPPKYTGYEGYAYNNYYNLPSASSIFDEPKDTWENTLSHYFYTIAINAQNAGLRYRKVNKENGTITPEMNNADVFNLDYDDSNSIVYDTHQAKIIPAKDAYNSLLSSLLPEAISYSAGLLKYFYDTKPTPDPNKLDYIDHTPYLSKILPTIKESVKYQVRLFCNGDAITIPVEMRVRYKDKQGTVKDILTQTKNVTLDGPWDEKYAETDSFIIPKDATELLFSYTLNYGVKPKGERSDTVKTGNMEISYQPTGLFLNELTQNITVYVKDKEDKEPIDGVKVKLTGCGIDVEGITDSQGRISFFVNPTYTRNDSLFAYISVWASTERYNYWSELVNILAIDRNPPNIMEHNIPEIGSGYAVVTWTTDVPSEGWIECDGRIIKGFQELKSQEIIIKGLSPGMNYPFKIKAQTRYSKDYGKIAQREGSFATRVYNNPPKIVILSPKTGETYKATSSVKYYVEDNDPVNGTTDRMDVTVLYGKVDGTTTWYELTTYTGVYTGTTSLTWNTENVGSGTFQIMVIATDWNEAPSTVTSGIFRIIAPLVATFTTAQGIDGGLKEKGVWKTPDISYYSYCPVCNKDITDDLYKHFEKDGDKEWVIAEIPYNGLIFGQILTITVSATEGFDPEATERGTASCKVRCWVYKDGQDKIHRCTGQIIITPNGEIIYAIEPNPTCSHLFPWKPCNPSSVAFTVTIKGYLADQKKAFDFDPPTVRLIKPETGKVLSATQEIRWEANTKHRPIRISLFYSKDQGKTWIPIAYNLDNTGTYLWNTKWLEDRDGYLIKVLANNGVVASGAVSKSFGVMNALFGLQRASSEKKIILPGDDLKLNLGFVDWPKDEEYFVNTHFTKKDGSLLWKEELFISTNTQGAFVYTQNTRVPGTISHTGKVDVRVGISSTKGGEFIKTSGIGIASDSAGRSIVLEDLFIPQITQKDGKKDYLKASPVMIGTNTILEYMLPKEGTVSVAIYAIEGNEIKGLFSGYQNSGLHSISWNGKDANGAIVMDGVYLFVVEEQMSELGYRARNKGVVIINNNSIPSQIKGLTGSGTEISYTEDEVVLKWETGINKPLLSYGVIPYGYNIYYQGEKMDTISANDIWQYIQGKPTNPKFSLSPDLLEARYSEKRPSRKSHPYSVALVDLLGNEGKLVSEEIEPEDIYPPSVSIIGFERILKNSVKILFKGEDNIDAPLEYICFLNQEKISEGSYKGFVILEGLLEGKHIFSVKARDSYGNISQIATKDFIIDITPPTITQPQAIPDRVSPYQQARFSAYVTDNISGVASVTVNLSSVGGPENQPMFDDGTNGDEVANDGTYTFAYTIPDSVSVGTKTLSITARDKAGNSATVQIILTIERLYIKQLTTDPNYDGSEVFSPDGQRIVYRSFASGKGNLWVMDVDGSNKKQILPDGWNGCGPNFSPDGKWLAFSNGDDIFVMTNIEEVINGSVQPKLVQLTTGNDDNDHWPDWSPDGKWLAYGSTKNGNRDIYVITNVADVINQQATPQVKRITTHSAYENGPCFSPDGKKIVFISNRSGNWDDWAITNVVDVVNSNASPVLVQITKYEGNDEMGRFSSDGSRFAFSSMRPDDTEYNGWLINNIEDVFNGLPADITPLTNWPGHEGPDDWSKDGTKLLIGSTMSGNWDIWIADYLYDESAFPSANITYPILNQVVSGKVEIKGTAKDNISVDGKTVLSKLSSYTVEYGKGDNPTTWTKIITTSTPVENGILALWDTTGLENGIYTIRLTATDGEDTNTQKIIVEIKNKGGFFDNFDDGNADGWQATGLWHLEKKRFHSSPYSFAYNNGTNYNTGGRNSGYIVSPDIDLTSVSSAKLSFWTYWQHESWPSGSYDNMKVEVYDGAWHQIFYNDCNEGPSYSDWHKEELDISSYCGKKIKLRFSFDTVDGAYNNYEGWYIDDVKVEFLPPPPPSIFEESFDDGDTNGWSLTGLWHITNKRSDTPQYSIAYNNGTNYDVGRTYGGAISPVIDLTKEDKAILSFRSWYETENSGTYWDRKIVYIATEDTNYTNWTQIAQVSGTMRQWQAYTANLAPYCGKKIKIRFWFDTIDHILNRYEGWYIDSIKIERKSSQGISSIAQSGLSYISSVLDRRTSSFLKPVDTLPPFEALMSEVVMSKMNGIEATRKEKGQFASCFFDSDSSYAVPGSLIEEEIWIETQEDLLGAELIIAFDPEKIEIKEIKEGDIFLTSKGLYVLNNEEGYLKIQIVGDGHSKDKASLFTIRFYAKSLPATIKIQKADLRDNLNHKIEIKAKDLLIDGITLSELLSAYPNPAKDGCFIPFKLSEDSNVKIEVYNILGQKVRTIDGGYKKAGFYTKQDRAIFWDLKNNSGQKVSKGLYFYELKAGKFTATKAMVVK